MTLSFSIGCIDSGLGGLSVMQAIRQQMPQQDMLYVADTKFSPYGSKTAEQVQLRLKVLTSRLIAAGAQLIVLACNSATLASISLLRRQFSVPFVGVEPGIKPAIQQSKTSVIGVLATALSLQGERFDELVKRYAPAATLVKRPCPELVELLDQGRFNDAEVMSVVKLIVGDLKQKKVDVVILACTHYLFFKPIFRALLGPDVVIVDTGEAIARQVARLIPHQGEGLIELCATDNVGNLKHTAEKIMPEIVQFHCWQGV